MRLALISATSAHPLSEHKPRRPRPDPVLSARQGSFFIGGPDVTADTLSSLLAYAPWGPVTIDQMHVRNEAPVGTLGVPTGASWRTFYTSVYR